MNIPLASYTRTGRGRTLVATLMALTAALGLTASAAATGTPRIGTPQTGITARAYLDTYQNFVILDTSQAAATAGWLTKIDYYAQATGTIRFVLTDAANVVRWVGNPITVTSVGLASATLPTPVAIGVGWRLGYYTAGTGVIPFDYTSPLDNVEWTDNNTGVPPIPSSIPTGLSGNHARVYSMGANTLSSKDQCKDGGWMSWGVFKNQGDCVSFVATGGRNLPAGS